AVAARGADAEEDAEAGPRVERAVAVELEVARLAADHEPADGDLRADRREADERLVRAGAGVDGEVLRRQGQDRPEGDPHRGCAELERRDVPVGELERGADGLGGGAA